MDPTRRFFAGQMLELQVRRAKGHAYEALFNAVMQRRYPGFIPMRPYGHVGDRKNDGYIPSTGTFFQVYAPNNPKAKLASAASKALADFVGLKQHWQTTHPIKDYRFVFNDEYLGSVVPVEQALAEIARQNSITASPFLAKDLEAEALQLGVEQLQDVLKMVIPAPGLIPDADYSAVRDVVEYVLRMAAPTGPSGKLIAPEYDEKIRFNGLSYQVADLLRAAAYQVDVVVDYFSNRSGTYRQNLRDHLAAIYVTELEVALGSGGTADTIFFAILSTITPQSDAMRKAVQDAAIIVIAYYFEACDIFEDPHATT